LAKTSLTEEDKKRLDKMFKRLKQEEALLKTIFSNIVLDNRNILDIGTGQGFACKFLVENSRNSLIITVDIDPLCLNRVRNVVGEKIKDIIFIKADLSNLCFLKSNFFHIALSHYTLSTIDEKKIHNVIREIHRVLVKNGLLIIVESFGLGKKDKARELALELEAIYQKLTGERSLGLDEFIQPFKEFKGFNIIEIKKLNDGLIDPTMEDFAHFLLTLTDDNDVKKKIRSIIEEGLKFGFREAPDYAIYLQKV